MQFGFEEWQSIEYVNSLSLLNIRVLGFKL